MTWYIIVIVLVVFASIWDLIRSETTAIRTIMFYFLFLLLFLFLGTRLVGPDLYTYQSYYKITPPTTYLLQEFQKFSIITLFEPGYLLLNGIARSLNLTFIQFNFLFSFGIVFIFFARLRKYTPFPLMGVLVFMAYGYMTSFSAIRQTFAASIFFFSLYYITNNKPHKYLIGILVASTFHASALILLIFYFLRNRRIDALWIIAILVTLISSGISGVSSMFASKIFSALPFFSPTKVEMYLQDSSSSFFGTVSLIWIATIILCLIFRKKLEQTNENFNLFFNVLWIGLAIFAMAVGFGGFGRVVLYFKVAFVVIFPALIALLPKHSLKFAGWGVIVAIVVATYFLILIGDAKYVLVSRYLPYESWLLGGTDVRP